MVTYKELTHRLHYAPETGVFTWIDSGGKKRGRLNGREAGCTTGTSRYRQIIINGKTYKAHRLAWLYMTGKWPENEIDHINRDRSDNRFSNLREATRSQNRTNSIGFGKLGIKGVYRNRNKFEAAITVNNKRKYLGIFDTAEEAKAAYDEAAKEHFGEFIHL